MAFGGGGGSEGGLKNIVGSKFPWLIYKVDQGQQHHNRALGHNPGQKTPVIRGVNPEKGIRTTSNGFRCAFGWEYQKLRVNN